MDEPLRSLHRAAYNGTDLFHDRGGTGGRSEKGFFFFPLRGILASSFFFRIRHFLSEEKKARADPRAALMAARRKYAGISGAISVSGMMGEAFFSVACVSFSSAVRASLFLRSKMPACA